MSEQIYCPQCGSENNLSWEFCSSCGASLEEARVKKLQTEQAKETSTSTSSQQATSISQGKENSGTLIPHITAFSIAAVAIVGLRYVLVTSLLGAVIGAGNILGIILAAWGIKRNKTLGIIGIILNSLCIVIIMVFIMLNAIREAGI